MAKLERIELIPVSLPTRRQHKWTGLTESIGNFLLVKLVAEDGTTGWGEAPALKDWSGDYGTFFGESVATVELLIERYLWPAIEGLDARDIVGLHRVMDKVVSGYPYAKAALEMAAYDLAGRSLGVPVWMLLGGKAREAVPVTHSIGLIDIDEAVRECAIVSEQGIRTIKLKVGVNPERDIEIVRKVREAVGDAVDLCVDANSGYRTPGEAVQIIRQMEPYGLKYVEQPCSGLDRIASVARRIDAPVMADESCWTAHDALQAARGGDIDIVSIYTTKPGGLRRAMDVASVADAAQIVCNINGSVETGVGNRANLHVAIAAPAAELSCVIPVSTPSESLGESLAGIYYKDDFLTNGFTFRDGCVWPDETPGLGYEIDEAKVKKYRVKNT